MRRLIGILAIATTFFFSLPTAVLAIDFGGISAVPANPTTTDARTGSWFVYTLTPGGSKTDALVITNNTDEEKTLELYPADSTPTTGNGFALKQKIEPMTAVGSWITLEQNSVKLAPHEKASVNFSLAVPRGQAPGLHAGGIMMSEGGSATHKNGIGLDLRLGVRMYVTVAAPVAQKFSMTALVPYLASALALAIMIGIVFKIQNYKKIKKIR